MLIFADVPWGGASNEWGCQEHQVFLAFSLTMTFNDLEWLFHIKFCFCSGLAASDRVTFKK